MNTDELSEKVKSFFSKSAEVSKNAFEKAGDKVQEFSDKSVIKIEKKQLESKMDAGFCKLGKKLYALISANELDVSKITSQEELNACLSEIADLQKQINEKEELLKKN